MAELCVWTDCAIARYRAKFWLYFMRAVIFLIFHSFGFVPKALDSQAQGLKVPASTGGCSGKVIRDKEAADVQH